MLGVQLSSRNALSKQVTITMPCDEGLPRKATASGGSGGAGAATPAARARHACKRTGPPQERPTHLPRPRPPAPGGAPLARGPAWRCRSGGMLCLAQSHRAAHARTKWMQEGFPSRDAVRRAPATGAHQPPTPPRAWPHERFGRPRPPAQCAQVADGRALRGVCATCWRHKRRDTMSSRGGSPGAVGGDAPRDDPVRPAHPATRSIRSPAFSSGPPAASPAPPYAWPRASASPSRGFLGSRLYGALSIHRWWRGRPRVRSRTWVRRSTRLRLAASDWPLTTLPLAAYCCPPSGCCCPPTTRPPNTGRPLLSAHKWPPATVRLRRTVRLLLAAYP